MNSLIISEFDRLIAFIQNETEQFKKDDNLKKVMTNKFRLKQLQRVLAILKKYPSEITLNNYTELQTVDGIGKGSLERIEEIIKTGRLKELGTGNTLFVDVNKEKKDALKQLEEVVGIGNEGVIRNVTLELVEFA